jgi:hypothetical protein
MFEVLFIRSLRLPLVPLAYPQALRCNSVRLQRRTVPLRLM